MKTAELGDIFLWDDKLVKVTGINTGHKSIYFEEIGAAICPTCGVKKSYEIIEGSPLFQNNAKPIKTLKT